MMKRFPVLKHLVANDEIEGSRLIAIAESFKNRLYQFCRSDERVYRHFEKEIASFKEGGNEAVAIVRTAGKSITFFSHSVIDEKKDSLWAKNLDSIEIAFLFPKEVCFAREKYIRMQ